MTPYIEDVLWLCYRANPDMTEAEKLSRLMKGMAEGTFLLLVVKENGNVSKFLLHPASVSRRRNGPIRASRPPEGYPTLLALHCPLLLTILTSTV